LYHAAVALQIIDGDSLRRFRVLALAPPGNLARDIALFRRRIFSSLGEASALAYPEIVPLAFAGRRNQAMSGDPAAGPRAPGPGKRAAATGAARALASAWSGVAGPFELGGLGARGGGLYLELEGPLAALASSAEASLGRLGIPSLGSEPLAPAFGFFVCRFPPPGLAADEALGLIESLGPPHGRFLDCALVLYRITRSSAPFAAVAWSEEARARRLSGPSPGGG
jgi:hypothetical protein